MGTTLGFPVYETQGLGEQAGGGAARSPLELPPTLERNCLNVA